MKMHNFCRKELNSITLRIKQDKNLDCIVDLGKFGSLSQTILLCFSNIILHLSTLKRKTGQLSVIKYFNIIITVKTY